MSDEDKDQEEQNEEIELLPLTKENVVSVISEQVNPVLEMHNGYAEVGEVDEEAKTVTLKLQGGCAGCPASTITLFRGIVPILQKYFDLNDVLLG